MTILKAGIIAAGKGERFARAGYTVPKPLIPVGGVPLIERTIRALEEAGAEEFVIILNTSGGDIRRHILKQFRPERFLILQKDTGSSFESFREVARCLPGETFFITTVDSVYDPQALTGFLSFAQTQPDGVLFLGLTDYIHDEKPLWAKCSQNDRMVDLGPTAEGSGLATSGLYFGKQKLLDHQEAGDHSSLSSFLSDVVRYGQIVYGYKMPKTIDVDTPEDIADAENWIKNSEK